MIIEASRSGGRVEKVFDPMGRFVQTTLVLEKERKAQTRPYIAIIYVALFVFLFTIVLLFKTFFTSIEGTHKFYDIYRVNPETLALGDMIYSFSAKNYVTFFEGDTALYWTETDTATGNIYVVRLPIDGNAVYCMEISDTTPQYLAIDESQGKILVSFQDETPESPFYYLQDIASGDITEADVEPAFFSKSKLGNGQFVILD